MEATAPGTRTPELSPLTDIADQTHGQVGDGTPALELLGPPARGADTSQNGVDIQAPVPTCHQDGMISLVEELCRLARDLRRRVNTNEVLPALAALSALGPLHGMLTQQMAARLMAETTEKPAPPAEVDVQHLPPAGYL
ncbi:uncharacterized protein METZ01_LOCUS374659 [marine metagenome]|uniref:Uncharacterized protein n=1 Tax=marine metagenome TaxID=408172 RepID=A0A382TJ48_9ZZZZ